MKETRALLLAAGFGTRLKPLTDIWPKCLMPIRSRPLLEYWLNILKRSGIDDVLVNTHYLSEHVNSFLKQPQFIDWVNSTYESNLLGTAGTIRKNSDFCKNSSILLAHADNWMCCNFSDFLYYHHNQRPKDTVMTMMTFTCHDPRSCGIVELNDNNVIVGFHEKVENPPGYLANAAVYVLEPEVIEWIKNNPSKNDFSAEVISEFIGRIATWENKEIHRDIGTIKSLREAQNDVCDFSIWDDNSSWQQNFLKNKIHQLIDNDS